MTSVVVTTYLSSWRLFGFSLSVILGINVLFIWAFNDLFQSFFFKSGMNIQQTSMFSKNQNWVLKFEFVIENFCPHSRVNIIDWTGTQHI